MKIITGVVGLIASLGLFVAFAYAQQQNDPGMQQSDKSMSRQQTQQQAALKNDPQTVKQVQQSLFDKGFYSGSVNGKWNSKTESALRMYQSSQNLPSNGQLDQQTLASLGISGAAAGGTPGGVPGQPSGGASGLQSPTPGQQSGSKY